MISFAFYLFFEILGIIWIYLEFFRVTRNIVFRNDLNF